MWGPGIGAVYVCRVRATTVTRSVWVVKIKCALEARALRDRRLSQRGCRYAGVFQALQLQARGYPIHVPIKDFMALYSVIVTENLHPPDSASASAAPPDTNKAARQAIDTIANSGASVEEKANAIKDYVLNASAHLRLSKDAGRIWTGKTRMLYCGTWCVTLECLRSQEHYGGRPHLTLAPWRFARVAASCLHRLRALEILREPARKRADLRRSIEDLVRDTGAMTDDKLAELSMAVRFAAGFSRALFARSWSGRLCGGATCRFIRCGMWVYVAIQRLLFPVLHGPVHRSLLCRCSTPGVRTRHCLRTIP